MNIYLILKSLHLIAVISWMAGLLYLPRIFVYHSENKLNNDISGVFKIMERRLYFYIMYPAMLLSWIFGVSIIHFQGIELLKAMVFDKNYRCDYFNRLSFLSWKLLKIIQSGYE